MGTFDIRLCNVKNLGQALMTSRAAKCCKNRRSSRAKSGTGYDEKTGRWH